MVDEPDGAKHIKAFIAAHVNEAKTETKTAILAERTMPM